MRESSLSRTLVKYLRDVGCHAQRVEDRLASGIPDINLCLNGKDIWIETKVVRHMKDDMVTRTGLSSQQIIWATLRKRAGGKVFLVFKIEDRDEWFVSENFDKQLQLSDCICFKNCRSLVFHLLSIPKPRAR